MLQQLVYLRLAVAGTEGDPQAGGTGRHGGGPDRADQKPALPELLAQLRRSARIAHQQRLDSAAGGHQRQPELFCSAAKAAELDAEAEAASALVALGYKPQEASRMVSKIAKPGADCETLIRDALRAAL